MLQPLEHWRRGGGGDWGRRKIVKTVTTSDNDFKPTIQMTIPTGTTMTTDLNVAPTMTISIRRNLTTTRAATSKTTIKRMKCKHVYIALVALFLLIATISIISANEIAEMDEVSQECLANCENSECDRLRKSSRPTCFMRCMANCLK